MLGFFVCAKKHVFLQLENKIKKKKKFNAFYF